MTDFAAEDGAEVSGPGKGSAAKGVEKQIEKFLAAAHGVHPRTCPACGKTGRFTVFGTPPRYDARCKSCAALERHRLFALMIQRRGDFGAGQKVLHFAPERQLGQMIRARVKDYETADIGPKMKVTHRVNIEATGLPDAAYDRIVCNHVIEHVDDRKALAEMFRILKPGGKAFLMTNVVEGWDETYEDQSVTGEEERNLHFGQGDHLRIYGRDIRDRIRAAGFTLEEFVAVEPDVKTYGLIRGERVFIATRPE